MTHLSGVAGQHDGVEVATVVVTDEVDGGEGGSLPPLSRHLVLHQRLVEGEHHLQPHSHRPVRLNELRTNRPPASDCRLATSHCILLSHLHRLGISHTDECPCGTEPQTPETHPPALSSPRRQPTKPDMAGGKRRCRRSFGDAARTWKRLWTSSW